MSDKKSSIAESPIRKIPWPHAPLHRLSDSGTYFLTVSTYQKQHHFRGADRLAVLHRGLLTVARKFGWQLEAWAVFSNHYHFVGHSPQDEPGAASLSPMLGHLHQETARWVNRLDGEKGREVWHNFRDTRLTYERSYLARLNYVHQNAVKHGLVLVANQYPWCSAAWFERTARAAQVKTIYGFKTDSLNVYDEDEVDPDW
jgi:putative transposase